MNKKSFIFILILAGVGMGGCQVAEVGRRVGPEAARGGVDSQMAFWHTVAMQSVISNDEAFHGLLLYLDGKDGSAGYEDRVNLLRSRGLLPAGFNGTAGQAVQRGTLAVAILKTLKISGGLILNLFGASPRYSVRELQYAGIYPRSSPQQTFSGSAFVAVIGRVEDYQRSQTVDRPAPALPDEEPVKSTQDIDNQVIRSKKGSVAENGRMGDFEV